MKKSILLLTAIVTITFINCRKPKTIDNTTTDNQTQKVMNDIATNVVWGNFSHLQTLANSYYADVVTFYNNPSDAKLNNCRNSWKNMRAAWEQCEAFLYGPVETQQFDPATDTWPVNYNDMDALLASSYPMVDDSIAVLDDALKGYHPMEYLIWGKNGNKTAAAFTTREKEYLMALANYYKSQIAGLTAAYDPSSSSSFLNNIYNAGTSGSIYNTKRAAMIEMINGMIGICDEVANGKMEEPFVNQDASLEESPYSGNSLTDFTNNIKGVYNVYNGVYLTDGKGFNDWVNEHNLSLNSTIETQIQDAISALQAIQGPFGVAIFNQATQINNAQDAINKLKATLENDLTNLVTQEVTD